MRILVTGATGFIGSHLIKALLKENKYEVVALARNPKKIKNLEKEGVEVRIGDLTDKKSLKSITKKIDVVVHLGAYMRFHAKWEKLFSTNVAGTLDLANDALENEITHFIYTSSTEAIGPVKVVPADETHPLNPAYQYGISKMMAEKILNKLKEERGLPVTILRPTGVYGPGDHYITLSTVKAVKNEKLKQLPGKGDKYVHFTYVDDVVQGFIKTIENPQKAIGETFIIASDDYYTYKDSFAIIADILGVEPPKKFVPVSLAYVAMWFMEKANKIRRVDDFATHASVVRDMTKNRAYSNKKAKEVLGFQPKYTFPEGMKITIDWYIKNNLIWKQGYKWFSKILMQLSVPDKKWTKFSCILVLSLSKIHISFKKSQKKPPNLRRASISDKNTKKGFRTILIEKIKNIKREKLIGIKSYGGKTFPPFYFFFLVKIFFMSFCDP